jgi:hypothetical protein
MAFGTIINSATGASTGTSVSTQATSTSLTVSVGDLVVVGYAYRTNSPVTITDNLSNTWTALTDKNGVSNTEGMSYTIVTVAGTMTPQMNFTAVTSSKTIYAAQIAGPFASSVLDINPAVASVSAGTVNGNATGTLSQGPEIAISYANHGANTGLAVSGSFTLITSIGISTNLQGGLSYLVVNDTTSLTPSWTVTANGFIGSATFKAANVADLVQLNQSAKRAAYW